MARAVRSAPLAAALAPVAVALLLRALQHSRVRRAPKMIAHAVPRHTPGRSKQSIAPAGPPLWAAGSNRACTTRTTAGGPHGCRGLPRPYSVVERYCTLIKSKLQIGYPGTWYLIVLYLSALFHCAIVNCSYYCPGGTLLNRYGCVYVKLLRTESHLGF